MGCVACDVLNYLLHRRSIGLSWEAYHNLSCLLFMLSSKTYLVHMQLAAAAPFARLLVSSDSNIAMRNAAAKVHVHALHYFAAICMLQCNS
jgi:hypothetical protein